MIAAGLTSAAAVSSANAATVISSSAYGVQANLNVLNLLTANLGPVGSVSGAAGAAYSKTGTVASVDQTLGLGVLKLASLGEHVNTGVITSTASGSTATGLGAASSTISNLSTDLRTEALGLTVLDLLGLSARTITSNASVSDVGGLSATGSSVIEGLAMSGSVFKGFTYDAAALVAAAPNTVLFNLGGLEIILNQQIGSGDGLTSKGIATNAIDLTFTNFAMGTNLLNGSIDIGHSQASITGFTPTVTGPGGGAVPEPGVWALMIMGCGGAGAMMRRQRAVQAIAA